MQIKLHCSYYYKGSSNIDIRLESHEEEKVEIYSSYGEKMAIIDSYYNFKRFMDELLADKYAE